MATPTSTITTMFEGYENDETNGVELKRMGMMENNVPRRRRRRRRRRSLHRRVVKGESERGTAAGEEAEGVVAVDRAVVVMAMVAAGPTAGIAISIVERGRERGG
jgi:hypothetical protein